MLVPAMLLVLVCLGSVAVDLSLVHAAHRHAHRVASVAAEDASGMIDERELQRSGTLVLDADAAVRTAQAHLRVAELIGEVVDVRVVAGATTLDVTLVLEVPRVFGSAVPGAGPVRIDVNARGRLHR